MSRFISALILIGIAAFFLVNNFFTGFKNNLASLVGLRPLSQPELVQQGKRIGLSALVYSSFPLNYKHLIAINAGATHGVRVGMPVTLEGNILIGQIIEVSEDQSLVRTIFDKDWSLPVRIGVMEHDALLVGGQDPKLTLIDKDQEINIGDQVISAKKDLPYGLKVGEVAEVNNLVAHSFKEAGLIFPYNSKDLRSVVVLLK
ncbi:MAG: rod shape-determining protein MreC [bacterium]|nr:rod shape-determining protein MreC [bacterium]